MTGKKLDFEALQPPRPLFLDTPKTLFATLLPPHHRITMHCTAIHYIAMRWKGGDDACY